MVGLERQFMMRPARRILEQCLNVQPGEELLVLTDTTTSGIGEVFALSVMRWGRGDHGHLCPAWSPR